MTAGRKCTRRRAFTLLEVMIIVALIGLLRGPCHDGLHQGAQANPGQAHFNDARIIETAIDAWAMENHKADGNAVDIASISQYAKSGNINPNDVMGNPYGIGPVGTNQVRICTVSKTALSGVTID